MSSPDTAILTFPASGLTRAGGRSAVPLLRFGPTLLILTLLGAMLRFTGLGAQGYWRNELFSLAWIHHSVGYLLTRGLFVETNPPLYFLLLKAWTALWGESESAVRALSALASIAAIPLAGLLGLTLAGAELGLAGAALLALTPAQIVYAQEARGYALMVPLVLAAMLGAARFLRRGPGHPASGLVLYALADAALLWTHATGMLAVAALAVASAAATTGRADRRMALMNLAAATALGVVLGGPAVVGMLWQAHSANIAWIPRPNLIDVLFTGRFLALGPLVRPASFGLGERSIVLVEMLLAAMAILATLALALRSLRDGTARALLVLFPLLFLVLVLGVSLKRPILIPRIFLWVGAPGALALAAGLTGERLAGGWGVLRGAATVLVALCLGIGLLDNVVAPVQHKPDWRDFVRDVRPGDPAGPMLVAGPHIGALGLRFYTRGPIARMVLRWTPPTSPRDLADIEADKLSGARPIGTARLAAMAAAGRHFVLFLDAGDRTLMPQIARLPRFATARRTDYPGLTVLTW